MKIAFLVYDRPGYRGGPIVNARRLLPELARRGHDVHAIVLFFGGGAPTAEWLTGEGVTVHAGRFGRYTEHNVGWLLRLVSAIQPDVFVPNLSVAGWFAARWVREAGIPTVAALRSDDDFHWEMVRRFVLGPPEWAVSGLVCVSDDLHARVADSGPGTTRLVSIPSGVPVPANMAAHESGPIRLVYVGRLAQVQKRIMDVVDAMARVMAVLPDTTATLIGHGAQRRIERDVDRRIARHGLRDRIVRIGTVPPESISETLQRHHVLVLLSDYEGTPGAVMDGMAAGLVPVCLDIPGGVQELVTHGETGLLVKDRDGDFVSAIRQLAGDPALRARLGMNARRRIEQGYSLAVAADRWEAFLAELSNRAGQRTAIQCPSPLPLPPVSPAFLREDRRQPGWLRVVSSWTSEVVQLPRGPLETVVPNTANDDFMRPHMSPFRLDLYHIRHAVWRSLESELPRLRGVLLDVGCGRKPYKGMVMAPPARVTRYIGLDLADNPIHDNQPDITWNEGKIPLDNDSVDCAICTEVLEHCPEPEAVLAEVCRVMRPDGLLVFTVPFLWPLHETPFDEYRYTPYALRRHLENSGFDRVDIRAMGGWDASLAQMLGLWVRRRPMNRWLRGGLSVLTWPLVWVLLRSDRRQSHTIREQLMLTGLSGTARKPTGRDSRADQAGEAD